MMAIPKNVQSALDAMSIDYSLIDTVETGQGSRRPYLYTEASNNVIKSIILKDDTGYIQALIPSDHILDLKALQQMTQRALLPLSPKEIVETLASHHLESFPAIPHWNQYPSVISGLLLKKKEVFLESGSHEQLIHLSQAEFRKLLQPIQHGDFTENVHPIIQTLDNNSRAFELNQHRDRQQITTAVETLTHLRIKKRLEETLELPPLPETAYRIIKLRVDPTASIADLAKVVDMDPSLAAQVISWASSPYYSAPGEIKSVHDAIVRVLGFDLVMNLALGLSLGKTLRVPSDGPAGYHNYWLESIYTATAMNNLSRCLAPDARPDQGLCYLSGLLHNMGYLLLAHVFPPHFQQVCRYQACNPHIHHRYLEQYILGITREQLGAYLIEHWQLPLEVCRALRFQNDADYSGAYSELANLLFTSQRLLAAKGLHSCLPEPIPLKVFDQLGLDVDEANAVIDGIIDARESLEGVAQIMSN